MDMNAKEPSDEKNSSEYKKLYILPRCRVIHSYCKKDLYLSHIFYEFIKREIILHFYTYQTFYRL